jgi:FAD/FMN-containing dehydrogenase
MMMRRRSLLKGLAASAALPPVLWSRFPALAATVRSLRRVRPSDPAWPSAASWQTLKDAVGGNLIAVQPLFGVCAKDPKGAACADVMKNMANPFYVGDQPGGTQVSGWLNAWAPAPSAYAVKAQSTADVVAAVNFARENNLRLVVKGTGHSYQGTSNAADSLLIWTRAMNKVVLHDAFVPMGCEGKSAPAPAVTAQAGAMSIDLYNLVTTQGGRYVQGGGCTDLGIAGLIQSGGFGSFSKGFGTVASGLLEAEVVTADGTVRIANACMNSDLFWAIKGGGGGSWGVITKVTVRTHDLPEFMGVAWGTIRAQSDDAFRKLIARFVNFYAENLCNPHWGEQAKFGSDNTLDLSMVSQGLSKEQVKQVWQPFFDWVHASPHDFSISDALGTNAHAFRHLWDVAGNDAMNPDTREGAPKSHGWWQGDQAQVGAYLHGYDSLWLPASLLQPEQRQRFADALFAGSRHKRIDLHFNKGLVGATAAAVAAAKETATNPGVIDAFALVIIADGEAPAYPGFPGASLDASRAKKDAEAIDQAAAELRKIAPNAGSYVSESNYFNPRWQQAFWGENYPKLQAVKNKYDPDGLFFVHHGVGSESWSADGFTRVA